jgi:hypothetical protein
MIEKNIKDLEIKWIDDEDWWKFRDFLISKLKECDTEKQFNFVLEGLVGSMFKNVEEMDKTRKALQLDHITRKERRRVKEATKDNE